MGRVITWLILLRTHIKSTPNTLSLIHTIRFWGSSWPRIPKVKRSKDNVAGQLFAAGAPLPLYTAPPTPHQQHQSTPATALSPPPPLGVAPVFHWAIYPLPSMNERLRTNNYKVPQDIHTHANHLAPKMPPHSTHSVQRKIN